MAEKEVKSRINGQIHILHTKYILKYKIMMIMFLFCFKIEWSLAFEGRG